MSSNSANHLHLGASLPAPNVQELAQSGDEVPERYFRHEAETSLLNSANSDDQVPVIDLINLLHLDQLEYNEELSRLGLACREWGFFQLINHGIPEEVVEKMKDDIKKFFELPLKDKEEVKQLPGHIEGLGQIFVHSEEQKLDWADTLILRTQPFQDRDMRFWPTNPTTFRDTLETYTLKIGEVVDSLYRLMAKDLGVDPQVLLNIFSGQMQSVRINYYPPCKRADKVLGLSPHSDGIALTVLMQTNDVNGLQIKKNDKWVLVKPKPGSFIVNVGDMLEIITNGKYKSIEHRTIINTEKERLSIAAFHLPCVDVVLQPLSELVGCDGTLYKSISVKEYTREYFSGKLNGKKALERMKLNK